MSVPSNYNDPTMLIRVDANTLYQEATVDLMNEATVILNALNSISQIWEGLKLGWAGNSAQEAQDFNDQWNGATQKLFGTQDDPSTGALNKVIAAVDLASINYGEAEDVVNQMFKGLVGEILSGLPLAIPSAGGLTDPPAVPPTRNQNDGPVTEHAPAPSAAPPGYTWNGQQWQSSESDAAHVSVGP